MKERHEVARTPQAEPDFRKRAPFEYPGRDHDLDAGLAKGLATRQTMNYTQNRQSLAECYAETDPKRDEVLGPYSY